MDWVEFDAHWKKLTADIKASNQTIIAQSDQISKQGKRISEQRAWIERLCEPKDLCPVCLTWSWAPCDAGDEGAEQRGEKWVLCQCCNDSRIAMLWKAENVKLRDACKAQHEYIKEAQETLTSYLRPGGIEANRCLGLLLSQFDGPVQRALFKQTEAALGEGGGG